MSLFAIYYGFFVINFYEVKYVQGAKYCVMLFEEFFFLIFMIVFTPLEIF